MPTATVGMTSIFLEFRTIHIVTSDALPGVSFRLPPSEFFVGHWDLGEGPLQ
jgi:hypothetical protein